MAFFLRKHWALKRSRFGDAVLLIFILAQAADGVLTYLGVTTGVATEGNPLVAWYIATFGIGAAMIGAKTMAIVLGAALHMRAMHRTIGLLAILYLAVAVLPWTQTLFN